MEQQNDIEKFGTPEAWARELGLAPRTITIRLQEIVGITAKNVKGRLIRDNFFSESQVRAVCADLLRDLPKADSLGFIYLTTSEGEAPKKYGNVKAWSREFGLGEATVTKRLKGQDAVTGKDASGHVLENGFYSEQIVLQVCGDLMREVPRADQQGFFLSNNSQEVEERYGTKEAWSRELKISSMTIRELLQGIDGKTGRETKGRIVEGGFYPESTIRELCQQFIALPLADETGFFELEKEGSIQRYGTKNSWSKELAISRKTLISRLKGTTGISGRDPSGRIIEHSFYSELVIREVFADMLNGMRTADETGFFIVNGNEGTNERYGHLPAWIEELGLSGTALKSRLKDVSPTPAKDKKNRVIDFYPESAVRRVASDLLQELPQSDTSGFFALIQDGVQIRFGNTPAWSRELGINLKTLYDKLRLVKGVTGKDSGGRVLKDAFYSEAMIRQALDSAVST